MIKIEGHSGCILEIKRKDNRAILRKTSSSPQYSPRLEKQANKQSQFECIGPISTPEIKASGYSEEKYWFEMSYINGYNFLSFIERARPQQLEDVWNSIRALLLRELSHSSFVSYPKDVFLDKVHQVATNIDNHCDITYAAIDYIKNFSSSVPFPIGECHGDLTFSNMIIGKDMKSIYLIDFLDNFCRTPIQDIAKIRQDTYHRWTMKKCHEGFDHVKIDLVFKFLDCKILDFISYNPILREFYKPIQVINLLRILMYTSDKFVYNYLIQRLEVELSDEFNITGSW
tara:strand:- start:2477 stop:3334 length:858 start_codon:yes stop_codon:yes gene_type:complete